MKKTLFFIVTKIMVLGKIGKRGTIIKKGEYSYQKREKLLLKREIHVLIL